MSAAVDGALELTEENVEMVLDEVGVCGRAHAHVVLQLWLHL